MSVLNVWLGADRALLSVDSAALDLVSGQRSHSEKILVLPNAGCAVGCMGRQLAFGVLAANVIAKGYTSFDGLADDIAVLMARAADRLPAMATGPVPNVLVEGYRLAVVGWSEAHCRMAARIVVRDDRQGPTEVIDLDGDGADWLSIWNAAELGEAPEPSSAVVMTRIVAAQQRLVDGAGALGLVGGNAVVAEVTRHTVLTSRFRI